MGFELTRGAGNHDDVETADAAVYVDSSEELNH
jgi:hypothetical protein